MYGGRVLTVAVNPRDVVALPRNWEYVKMRVCGYTVLDVTDVELDTALYRADVDDDGFGDENEFGEAPVDLDSDGDVLVDAFTAASDRADCGGVRPPQPAGGQAG